MSTTEHMPDSLAVWTLINSHVVSRCIHVIDDFGVPDALGGEPASAEELAARTGMDADALARMLRPVPVRAGWASSKPAFGWQAMMAHFAEHPDEAALFSQAMVDKSAAVVPAVVEAFDFSAFGTVVDIGGGTGRPAVGDTRAST